MVTSPSVTTNPNLLTGLATCGNPECGKGLTVVTGRSGQYHYYTCARRATAGKHACPGVRIHRHKLDQIVMDALLARVVQPAHLKQLLTGFLDVTNGATASREQELRRSREQETKLKDAIGGLYRLASIRADIDEDEIFLTELDTQRRRHRSLQEEIKSLERQLLADERRVTPEIVEAFGNLLVDRLKNGTAEFRQAYVRLLIDRVVLGHCDVHIIGSIKALEQAVAGSPDRPATIVPRTVREWCRLGDSNT